MEETLEMCAKRSFDCYLETQEMKRTIEKQMAIIPFVAKETGVATPSVLDRVAELHEKIAGRNYYPTFEDTGFLIRLVGNLLEENEELRKRFDKTSRGLLEELLTREYKEAKRHDAVKGSIPKVNFRHV